MPKVRIHVGLSGRMSFLSTSPTRSRLQSATLGDCDPAKRSNTQCEATGALPGSIVKGQSVAA